MIEKIQYATDEEWRQARVKAIGGSDAGALLGFNQYKSPYALWAEKTGKIVPEDISDREAVRLGNDLEDYVAQRFCEATGKKVRRCNFTLKNSRYPFAHANVDRVVVGENAGLECKTTSSWEVLQQCRAGEYPDTWYAQMQHYMMVGEYEKYYLAVICFGHGFFWFEIKRSDGEIAALEAAEKEFWDMVVSDTPPAADGSEATIDALKTIYAESNDSRGVIDLTAVSAAVKIYSQLDKQISELEKERDSYKAQIMEYMGDAPKGVWDRYTISYKTQQRRTFDKKGYEAANGTIPDSFYTVSSSRPFKVTVKK